MKKIYVLLFMTLLAIACQKNLPESIAPEADVMFDFSIGNHIQELGSPDYTSTIKNMQILIFTMDGLLYRQIVLPEGANAPDKLRLPWGKYYLVFAGNFLNQNLEEGVSTINSILATMPQDLSFDDANICVAPSENYYYYRVPSPIQMGIVNSINVDLRPATSSIIVNIHNSPAIYNTYSVEIHNIGKNLSMQASSLPPIVRVVKADIAAATPLTTISTKTFAGINAPFIRLCAKSDSYTDTLDYLFKTPVEVGKSLEVDFIFEAAELSVRSQSSNLRYMGSNALRIEGACR